MIVYLTSSPTGDYDGKYRSVGLDNRNHFLDDLKEEYQYGNILMITADPDNDERNQEMLSFFKEAFDLSGIQYQRFDLWDGKHHDDHLHDYSLIILGGGHVPTQNQFFKSIDLKNRIQDYNGIVMGISAGTMNCAETVYVQPEHDGESSPSFTRFIEGLGISHVQVLPHYQVTRSFYLDGLRLFEDITYKDSDGHTFICIVDGSYIKIKNNDSYLHGEGYKIQNGSLEKINNKNQILKL